MRILVVEDEKRLAQNLQELLRREGYTVDVSGDGVSGLDNALSGIYDLLVLDVMLPGLDGFALLQRLRSTGSRLPVLMLTARSELNDRVRGLDAGADYYLTKPFEPEELLACIRSLLRRGGEDAAADPEVTAFGDLTLHMGTFLLECGPRSVRLPPGVRPDGAADAERQSDRLYGAADPEGLGLRLRRRGQQRGGLYLLPSRKLTHLQSTVKIKTLRMVGYCLEVEA